MSTPRPNGRSAGGRVLAVTLAALVLVGVGVGVGMAATSSDSGSHPAENSASPDVGGNQPGTAGAGKHGEGKHGAGKHAGQDGAGKPGAKGVDPDRVAWSHKYGQDRSTMPRLSPAGAASAQEQAAAADLLTRTESATAQYGDLAKAKAAGYDLQASLVKKEKKAPRVAEQMKLMDAGNAPSGARMPMLHVGNKAMRADGKVLDPNAPETLMYGYQGNGKWKLMGVMYVATESYPNAPPAPGGPITRWHYHDKSGGKGLMMHIFFVPGNDLAHAYATEMG